MISRKKKIVSIVRMIFIRVALESAMAAEATRNRPKHGRE